MVACDDETGAVGPLEKVSDNAREGVRGLV